VVLPPSEFVAAPVELAMVRATQRHGEFVAHLAPERALLSKPKMVCIRRSATAGQAELGAHEFEVIPIS